MRFSSSHPITFVAAHGFRPGAPPVFSLRLAGGRIAALDCAPEPKDIVIDLQGALVLPGLINAHDHLELNNFPRMKWRDRYDNAREWIEDFQPRFGTDPVLTAAMAVPLEDRLWLGGIKNLLSGVTTVCHHNPLYPSLKRCFPVKVVRRFGFSHSLWIDGAGVERAYRKTPKHWPWIIHAAEGTDAAAAAEFAELERLHCVDHNTLLVHCVGLGKKEQARLIDAGGAAIWCPSSNDFLLGATLDFAGLSHARRLALGTDSRLSGSSDLLTEIRQAAAHHAANAENLLRMVTADAAALLNLPDAGVLRPGAPADLVILPRHSREPVESLLETDRAAIRLVMLGGKAQVGDPDLKAAFEAGRVSWTEGRVDGRAKLMNREWSDRLQGCAVHEPGVEL